MYRLDRQVFTLHNFESAVHQRTYWLSKSPRERLAAAWYLDVEAPQPLDRTHFTIRSREEHASKHI